MEKIILFLNFYNNFLNLIAENWLLILLFLVFIILFFLILRRWQTGIIAVFICLYFQDFIRKIIPGQPAYVMLLTDIFLFFAYFSFILLLIKKYKREKIKIWKPPFSGILIVFAGWCIVDSFNPVLPNIFFPMIGIRSYLWYVPLLFLGYYMFSEEKKFMKFSRILIYTSIPLTVVAILQYLFKESLPIFLQPFQGSHFFHSFIEGTVYLPSSVFGSYDRFSRQAFFLALFGGGLSLYKGSSIKQRILLIISTIFAIFGVFISGRRAPMYLLLIAGICFFFLILRYFSKSQIKKIFIFSALILLICFILVFTIFPDTGFYFFSSFIGMKIRAPVSRVLVDTAAIPERIAVMFGDFWVGIEHSGFLGFGTGSRSQGLDYIPGGHEWSITGGPQKIGVEVGLAKIWYELGPIGTLIFSLLFVSMFFYWLREFSYLKNGRLFGLGFSIFLFLFLMVLWFLKGAQILGETMTLVYFWFFMGVLFKLKSYEFFRNYKYFFKGHY